MLKDQGMSTASVKTGEPDQSTTGSATSIVEGETVLINSNHYKRIGTKLVNVSNPNDTIDIDENASMASVMLQRLGFIGG